jgi:hypothetical protein
MAIHSEIPVKVVATVYLPASTLAASNDSTPSHHRWLTTSQRTSDRRRPIAMVVHHPSPDLMVPSAP